MGVKKTEEYNKAYDLYCNSSLQQKDIAKVCGVSTVQLSKWATENNWKLQKTAQQTTAEQVIAGLYKNISDIQEQAYNEKRSLSVAETDKIVKITASIRSLRKRYDLSAYHGVLKECLEYINKINNEQAKVFSTLMLDFLKEKAGALNNDKSQ